LGDEPLGDSSLGDFSEEVTDTPKFRIIHEIAPQDFFEIQAEYKTDATDAQWKILTQGGAVRLAASQPVSIKQ
jgi:hypothetical protein